MYGWLAPVSVWGRGVVFENEEDPTDPEFVERLTSLCRIELVLLATGELQANLAAVSILSEKMRRGKIAIMARWPEDAEELREAGADLVFCLNSEAGVDFANHAHESQSGGAA
jgi:Trk K+ transport system NAD-binding subunit